MTDKQARKFEKLLEAHKDAKQARKVAASARGEVKGIDGRGGLMSALASSAGTKAVEAELDALKAERRALKKLHAFAVKHIESAIGKLKGKSTKPKKHKGKVKTAKAKPAETDATVAAVPTAANDKTGDLASVPASGPKSSRRKGEAASSEATKA